MSDLDPQALPAQDVIWIIGHAGHGKSTLLSAISRSRTNEGAPSATRFAVIDPNQPPPERLKAAILLVSAAEGPMPQTRDHLILARQYGLTNVVVFLNKMDIADQSHVDLVEMEIRELLSMYGLRGDKATVVRGSAKKALEGDLSAPGEPAIRRLLAALGEGSPAADGAQAPGFLRRLFGF